jgi:hypothetical protein
MRKNPIFVALFVTAYLAVYTALTQFAPMFNIAFAMFLFGPLLILWLVYTVLRFGSYAEKGLDKEEFGYQDKNKADLGIF